MVPDAIVADLRVEAPASAPFSKITAFDVDGSGRIYLLLAQDNEIRVFDRTGTQLRVVGRPGAGPGEFRAPVQLGVDHGDRLWVYDANLSRYTIYDSTGRHIKDIRAERPSIPCRDRRLRFAPNGDLIRHHAAGLVLGGGGNAAIPCRVSRLDTAVTVVDSFIPPPTASAPRQGAWTAYEPVPVTAIDPEGYVWRGVNDRYALSRLTFRGNVIDSLVGTAPRIPVTRSDLIRAQANHSAAWRRTGHPDYQATPPESPAQTYATYKPPIALATVDDTGRLWVALAGETDGLAWAFDIFDSRGVFLGRAIVDGPLAIPSVAGDDQAARRIVVRGEHVYGLIETEDGSDTVVRLRMNHAATPSHSSRSRP